MGKIKKAICSLACIGVLSTMLLGMNKLDADLNVIISPGYGYGCGCGYYGPWYRPYYCGPYPRPFLGPYPCYSYYRGPWIAPGCGCGPYPYWYY